MSGQFEEVYYGWQCKRCGLFYPFGRAPWEDSSDLYELDPEDVA